MNNKVACGRHLCDKGDDRTQNQFDKYDVPPANGKFLVKTKSSDGWCIDKISYGGSKVDLSKCSDGRIWLDYPCSGSYDGDCVGSELKIDSEGLKVMNCESRLRR